ncbi:uncharacterized protein LOC134851789 [Symsagittifera roscoffensis]|uniref:uncharacterized protein LOC134851789 n=1 Tax=Symsagittifera roscoffensis TaxID=84072 RepID=UPI00307C6A77
MSRRLRSLISSKYMYIFALSPCAEEKAFPGLAAHSMSRANIAKVRSEGGNNNQQREEFEFKDTSSVATEEKEKIECPRTQSIWSKLARESIRITPITHNGDESANGQNKSADSEIKVPRNVDFPEKLKLRTLVENVQLLESEENMEFLWKYFAQLVDRVCLYFYVVITMFISIDFIKYL